MKKIPRNYCCILSVWALLVFFNGAAAAVPGSGTGKGKPKPKPNIIVILTDDMGYSDISCFGGRLVPTPHIDRLAKEGMMLTQYYSAAPICSPSRAGMLTGNYPGRWNFCTFLDSKAHNRKAEQADFLDPGAPSIARFFKNAGYATGHFGKWHLGGGRDVHNAPGFEAYGYDEHTSTYESPDPDPLITATNWIWSNKDSIKRWDRTKYFVDKTLAFLAKHKGTPCFVNLWPDDVHTPWVPRPDGDPGLYPKDPQEEEALRRVLKEYDLQIGRLLDGLKQLGMEENTIVIFTSDNGPLPSFRGSRAGGLRGSKLSLYEGGIRMPFIIRWPGHVPAGKTDQASMVSSLDLLPSLLKMAGSRPPAAYRGDGIDRSSVFEGRASDRRKELYWEYGRNTIAYRFPKEQDKSPGLAIRSGAWKFLMNSDGSDQQLYYIPDDPAEQNNKVAQQQSVANGLKKKLEQWWLGLPRLISQE